MSVTRRSVNSMRPSTSRKRTRLMGPRYISSFTALIASTVRSLGSDMAITASAKTRVCDSSFARRASSAFAVSDAARKSCATASVIVSRATGEAGRPPSA